MSRPRGASRPSGRRRKRNRLDAFEGINITPFTDVLLVLLIIFMIAGSSLAPTGLGLSGLAAEQVTESVNPPGEGLTVEIDEDGSTRLLFDEKPFSWQQAEKLPDSTPVTLSISPTATAEKVIVQYDRLLNLGLREIAWAPPRD